MPPTNLLQRLSASHPQTDGYDVTETCSSSSKVETVVGTIVATGAAVFLASSDSDYITQQCLNVDGGNWPG